MHLQDFKFCGLDSESTLEGKYPHAYVCVYMMRRRVRDIEVFVSYSSVFCIIANNCVKEPW